MRRAALLTLLIVAPLAARGGGVEVGFDWRVVTRVLAERNLPNASVLYDDAAGQWVPSSYLSLREDRVFPLAWTSVSLSAGVEPWGLAVLTLDPGALTWAPEHGSTTTRHGLPATSLALTRRWRLDGLDPGDALARSWAVREAWVELDLAPGQALELTLGRQRWRVLDGWVYDDYGLGVGARLDVAALGGWPLALEARGLLAHRYWDAQLLDLPVADARVAWEWAPGSRLSTGVTVAWDRAGFVPALAAASAVEGLVEAGSYEKALLLALASPQGSGTVQWADVALALVFDELDVNARAALEWGGASFRLAGAAQGKGGRRSLDLLAGAAGLDLAWHATGRLDLTAFGLWFSGSGPLSASETGVAAYRAFVSLVPFLPCTSLFFNGGLAGSLATRHAELVGTSGRGVLAGGLGATLDGPWGLAGALTVAGLGADRGAPFTGGRFYGVEIDLDLTWAATGWLDVGAEGAVLTPGTFYRDERSVWRVTAGVEAHD